LFPVDRLRRFWSWFVRRWRYEFAGVTAAVIFFCLSVTPSLLPRGTLLQGLISGILAATGYGVGVALSWLVRMLVGRRHTLPGPDRTAWLVLAAAGGLMVVAYLYQGSLWQRDIHRLMEMPPPNRYFYAGVLLLAAVVGAALVGLVRLLRRFGRATARFTGRWVPAPVARLSGVVATVVLVTFVLNGILVEWLLAAADRSFKTINGETSPGAAPPIETLRAGGPGSLVSWASLGNEGRTFVSGGPTMDELERFHGTGGFQPIRVYAGLDSAPTTETRAALAVRELERTGAFGRRVLVVITTTGTGWVDAKAVDPLEYMYNGDTAMVGLQYSYLPSWISFMVDQARARDAGRELFNQVYRAWSARPVGQRPKLLVFGESLGSFGAESAFSGVDDMRNRTDGMLFLGPPNSNTLWTEFVARRDAGTRQVLPTYREGATVRFAADPDALLAHRSADWSGPRVVYLQHASDPIVWWSPRLMLNRPDWLAEPRGDDVLPAMRWYPFVTFWQTTADMAFSVNVPGGHGHNYGTEPVRAWATIAPPDGWTAERTAELEAVIGRL
jgi:uncharacterized membrane protein